MLDDARSATGVVGKRFDSCEYFIPDLIMVGEIPREISENVKSRLEKGKGVEKQDKVLIGTVAGDIHDIGKDMVTFLLDVSGRGGGFIMDSPRGMDDAKPENVRAMFDSTWENGGY
jgi:methanogenic corrinoid protein MtbC1